jgi:uncharacterized membrane protein YkoI
MNSYRILSWQAFRQNPLRRAWRVWLWSLFACGLLSVTAVGEEAIPFAQLPPPVQKGLQAQLGGGTFGVIEREEDEGEVTYTAEIIKSGRARDYTVDEAGTLVGMEVFASELPLPVQKTIQSLIAQGTIDSIDKALDDTEPRYDIDWKLKNGTLRSVSVYESGKLESVQVTLEETPAAARGAITNEAAKAQIKEIFKSIEDNLVYYDVTINRDGRDREFSVTDKGKLDSRQLFLSELPSQAQASVQRTIGAGKLVRIDQVFDKKKGVFPYEVESLVNGKPYDFSIGPKGTFLGLDQ